jgi:hypothetical protein
MKRRGVEIGVVADIDWKVESAGSRLRKNVLGEFLVISQFGMVRIEQPAHTGAKFASLPRGQVTSVQFSEARETGVDGFFDRGLRAARFGTERRSRIRSPIATPIRRRFILTSPAEHSKGQVLYGKSAPTRFRGSIQLAARVVSVR